jgi:opacity protein-like surface antigen
MTRSAHWSARPSRATLAFLLTAALGLALAPTTALADDDEPTHTTSEEWQEEQAETWGRKGPYLGVGGLAMFSNSGHLHDGVSLDDDTGSGFNVRLGLRTATWFALEVMYEQVMNFEVSDSNDTKKAKGWFWSLNGKGYLMTTKRLQPYGLIGLGAVSIQPRLISRRTGFGMRFGGGIDYHITKHFVANLEGGYALGIGTQVEDYGYGVLGAGLTYRF